MNNKTIIPVNSTHKYLSDIFEELPSNCLLNKGVTGCGGTTVELLSKRNSIIAVPIRNLVKNKSNGTTILGVTGEMKNDRKIINYLKSDVQYKKIVVTYDSIPRLIKLIGESIYEDYFLLIDEYHILFNDYTLRTSAIKNLLSLYTKFGKFCFMTATPISEINMLDELKDIDVIELE